MSYFTQLTLNKYGLAVSDAFGRARFSEPFTLFDSKMDKDNLPLLWDDGVDATGSGTSSTHSVNEAAVTLGVSNATAGKVIRQTFQRFNYEPGKSQLVFMTGILGVTTSGLTAEIGYFDDNNGIFFRHKDGAASLVVRSNVTGTPVENEYTQANWNLDIMTGVGGASNPSGVTIDFDKTQIFVIDFEWLGVGAIRFGFVVNGEIIYIHKQDFVNSITNVYMSTAVLPLRYSLENSGAGAAFSKTKQICSTVISEGGSDPVGITRHAGTGASQVNANSAGTTYALLGVKLQSSKINTQVDFLKASVLATTSDNYDWTLVVNPTVAGGGLTYSNLANSSVQVGIPDTGNPSTTTITGGTIIDGAYGAGQATSTFDLKSSLRLGSAIDGTLDEFVLAATPLTSNLDIYGSLTWKEF